MDMFTNYKVQPFTIFSDLVLLGTFIQNNLNEMWEIARIGMVVYSRNETIYVLKVNYADHEYFIYREDDSACIKRFKTIAEVKEFISEGCAFKE